MRMLVETLNHTATPMNFVLFYKRRLHRLYAAPSMRQRTWHHFSIQNTRLTYLFIRIGAESKRVGENPNVSVTVSINLTD
jgi:hypothetical protein